MSSFCCERTKKTTEFNCYDSQEVLKLWKIEKKKKNSNNRMIMSDYSVNFNFNYNFIQEIAFNDKNNGKSISTQKI